MASRGDILYRGATLWKRLAAGTSGQFLKTQGAGADPVWATPAGGGTVTHTAGALTANQLVVGNGSDDLKVVSATDGQIPIGTSSDGTVTLATITAGSNITVTNGAGSITIAATSGSGDYVKIAEATPSGTPTVTFSSLGSYTHLEIRYSARGDTAATSANVLLTFNSDTAGNYDRERDGANGTVPTASEALGSTSAVVGTIPAASATSNRPGGGVISIMDYAGTTLQKMGYASNTFGTGTASGTINVNQFGFVWRSTSAITRIDLNVSAGNFVAGSKFSLYGIT